MSQVTGTAMFDQIIDYFSQSFFDEEDSVSYLEALHIEVDILKILLQNSDAHLKVKYFE